MKRQIHVTGLSIFSARIQLAVFAFPVFFLLTAFFLHSWNVYAYHRLFGILERGLFEWVQFACYAMASCIGFRSCFAQRHRLTPRLQQSILLAFAVGCAFIALEEISYGQHIFKWATPERIALVNLQKETNFHNLAVIQGNHLQVRAFIAVGWFGSLAWLLRRDIRRQSCHDLILPEWVVSLYFLPAAVFYTQLLYVFGWGNHHQETFETVLSFGFLAIAVMNHMKLEQTTPAAALRP